MTDAHLHPWLGSAPGWPLVLYFHHVHPTLDHYTSLTPDSFARGVETVLKTVGPALAPPDVSTDPASRPEQPTVLFTFDDGYRDTIEHALPVLDAFGVRALFFLITDRVPEVGGARAVDDPWQAYLGWDDARHLERAGHRIGAHTRNHVKLTEVDAETRRREVDGSIEAVSAARHRTGPVPFAYPYGLVPADPGLPAGTAGFGTVKAPARPWSADPARIRRTYLPTNADDDWAALCRGWRDQWWASSR
ncbi:polysaccharide deacetylase family protein [Micromonospora sp. PLK6-60]|uniref:polysaccharide deacetylase family protein n=1 Tax=Micromonospora sp. PLK6-60 TaxID=2873383 RepID=UPI001CA79A9F|nr:polysaccharide deacetylase family protein [Micromonospora sp. PLK6-60]MBY8870656.1 polysaccharide deacetylase family protein [Micromonospora sp. PLK6-60]